MEPRATRLEVTELLGHVAWLRRLAASLVADAARADDLTQQVVLDALSRPPAEPSRPRAWLGTVARHLAGRTALSERRRVAREQAAAPREALPASDEVVARTELHRRVVDAVLALDERYRTPLLLRWFDGLAPRAIAERTGEPVETVKTRLKRGLELLRERLITEREGARGARGEGAVALLALLDRPGRAALRRAIVTGGEVAVGGGVAAVIAGVVAMGAKTKLAVAAVAVVVAGAAATWSIVALAPPAGRPKLQPAEESVAAVDAAGDRSARSDALVPATRIDEAAAELVAAEPPPPGTQPIRGRVVDEARRPVADAEVVLSITDRAPVATRTNARGEYAFAVEPLAAVEVEGRGSLFASDAAGRAGSVALFHPYLRDAIDYRKPRGVPETIVVRPGGALRVRVVDAAGPVAGATVRLELGEERERGPTAISGVDGEARFAALPIGPVVALASRDGRGRWRASGAVASAGAGGAEAIVEVALRPTRDLAVRVEDATTGHGVEGVSVKLYDLVNMRSREQSSFVDINSIPVVVDDGVRATDAEGRVTFHDVEAGAARTIAARKEGWEQVWEEERRSAWPLAGDAAPPTLYVAPSKREELRWRIAARAEPPLPDGVELRLLHADLQGRRPPETARVVDGHVVAEVVRGGELVAWAHAPDGRLAVLTSRDSLAYGSEGAIDFGPGRRLVVRAQDEGGRPLAGVAVVAELLPVEHHSIATVVETTDANGVARFDPLPAIAYRVHIAAESGARPDVLLPPVDLAHGDATVDFILPPLREAIVELTVDGARRVPADLAIRHGSDVPSRRVEDAERGEIHLFFVPRDGMPAHVTLEATGYVPTQVAIPWSGGDEPPRIAVELPRAATLTARLLAPEGVVCRPTLQRWREERREFMTWGPAGRRLQQPNTPDGAYRFTALPAGRWRVVEEVTGIGSDEVVIGPGGGDHALMVDLARTITVAGRCVLPDDPRLGRDDLELFVIDDELVPSFTPDRSMPSSAQKIWHERGVFETWLDGSRRWRLVARTPLHRLATAEGTLPISGTQRDLVLRFEERPLARFHARCEAGAPLEWVSVSCLEPAEAGAARRSIAWGQARRDGDAWVFAPPIGAFDLVATAHGHAALIRRAVRFDGSPLDLGELFFERGSRLTVNLATKAPEFPTTTLVARRIDDDELAPFDSSESYDRGTGVHRLEGLRRSRWRIELSIWSQQGFESATPSSVEIDIDGVTDATIEIAVD